MVASVVRPPGTEYRAHLFRLLCCLCLRRSAENFGETEFLSVDLGTNKDNARVRRPQRSQELVVSAFKSGQSIIPLRSVIFAGGGD